MEDQSLIHSHNKSVLHNLTVGDLVEFPRTAYSHWGVYIGNEEIIHVSFEPSDEVGGNVQPEAELSKKMIKAEVRKDNFWKVAENSKALKNNEKDEEWRPLSPEEIVKNAKGLLGHFGYDLLFSNCEHFVNLCRYRIWKSDQADNFITAAVKLLDAIGEMQETE